MAEADKKHLGLRRLILLLIILTAVTSYHAHAFAEQATVKATADPIMILGSIFSGTYQDTQNSDDVRLNLLETGGAPADRGKIESNWNSWEPILGAPPEKIFLLNVTLEVQQSDTPEDNLYINFYNFTQGAFETTNRLLGQPLQNSDINLSYEIAEGFTDFINSTGGIRIKLVDGKALGIESDTNRGNYLIDLFQLIVKYDKAIGYNETGTYFCIFNEQHIYILEKDGFQITNANGNCDPLSWNNWSKIIYCYNGTVGSNNQQKCSDGLNFVWTAKSDNKTFVWVNGTATFPVGALGDVTVHLNYTLDDRLQDMIKISTAVNNTLSQPIDDLNISMVHTEIRVNKTWQEDFVFANRTSGQEYARLNESPAILINNFEEKFFRIFDNFTQEFILVNWTNAQIYGALRNTTNWNNSQVLLIQPAGSFAVGQKKSTDFWWVDAVTMGNLRVQVCEEMNAETSNNSYVDACEGTYPADCITDRLSCDDGTIETATAASGQFGGYRINVSNSTITDCTSIDSVRLCVDRCNTQQAANLRNCTMDVSASANSGWAVVTKNCPIKCGDAGDNTSISGNAACTDVSSLVSWSCSNFFGAASGPRAWARTEWYRPANPSANERVDAFYFNVTYSTGISCPSTITSDTTLTADLSGSGTCLTIGNPNVTLNCDGFRISGAGTGEGVASRNNWNITIKNCHIYGFARNINFTNTTNSTIFSTNLTNATGSSFPAGIGLFISNESFNLNITDLNSSNNSLIGVEIRDSHHFNITFSRFSANNITGIRISNSSDAIIRTNSFTTITAVASDTALHIITARNITVLNNTFSAHDMGIRVLATNNTVFWNNTISSIDAAGFNISSLCYNLSLINNSLSGNEIDVEVADSNITLFINQSAQNYSFIRAGLLSFENSSSRLAFTNGSMTAAGNLTAELSLLFNRTFVNSTIRPGLNTTANITFFGLTFDNPEIMADREDDGTFIKCNSTTLPKCEEISYSGGTFTFNVTHFTTFTSRNNTPPGAPVLVLPVNNTVITNRTPTFVWNNSQDNESDVLLYNLVVSNDTAGGFPSGSIIINQTGIAEDSDGNTSFTPSSALPFDDTYFWKVRANDTQGNNGGFSEVWNFTIESEINVNLSNAIINFINLSIEEYNDTEDDNPLPFILENRGNVFVNITFNGTRLFDNGDFPGSAYQYRVNYSNSEPGAFNYTGSTGNWSNVTNNPGSPLRVDIMQLNWTDVSDLAEIEINITVPAGEPSGLKISNVSIRAVIGE